MKAVGVTLLVQGFNFFVAYALLRRFIFDPAATILEQQEAQSLQLQTTINQAFEQKKETKLLINQRLVAIKTTLQAQVPEQKTYKIACDGNQALQFQAVELVSEQEVALLAKKVADDLSKVAR